MKRCGHIFKLKVCHHIFGDPEGELMNAFRVLDVDGNGTLDRQELEKWVVEKGLKKMGDAEVQAPRHGRHQRRRRAAAASPAGARPRLPHCARAQNYTEFIMMTRSKRRREERKGR